MPERSHASTTPSCNPRRSRPRYVAVIEVVVIRDRGWASGLGAVVVRFDRIRPRLVFPMSGPGSLRLRDDGPPVSNSSVGYLTNTGPPSHSTTSPFPDFSPPLTTRWGTDCTPCCAGHHKAVDWHQICASSAAPQPAGVELAQQHGYRRAGDPFTLPNRAKLWPVVYPAAALTLNFHTTPCLPPAGSARSASGGLGSSGQIPIVMNPSAVCRGTPVVAHAVGLGCSARPVDLAGCSVNVPDTIEPTATTSK
jgi:hypothetical protein